MSKEREAWDASIRAKYETLRDKLSDDERPLFDEAMQLMEKLSKVDTSRTLALDAALAFGLSSITLCQLCIQQMPPMLARNLGNLLVLDMEVRSHGSSYRH